MILWDAFDCDGDPGALHSEYCASVRNQMCADQGPATDLSPEEGIFFLESYPPAALNFVKPYSSHHPTKDLPKEDDPDCNGEECDRGDHCTAGFLAWWNNHQLCDESSCWDSFPDQLDDGIVDIDSQMGRGFFSQSRVTNMFGIDKVDGEYVTGECHFGNETKPYNKRNWVMWWPGAADRLAKNLKISEDLFKGECATYLDPGACAQSEQESSATGLPLCGTVPELECAQINGLKPGSAGSAEPWDEFVHPTGTYSSLHRCSEDATDGQPMVCVESTIGSPTIYGETSYAACVRCDDLRSQGKGCPSEQPCGSPGDCPQGEECIEDRCFSSFDPVPEWLCLGECPGADDYCYRGGAWADTLADVTPAVISDAFGGSPICARQDGCQIPDSDGGASLCSAERLVCEASACTAECEFDSDCDQYFAGQDLRCESIEFGGGRCVP